MNGIKTVILDSIEGEDRGVYKVNTEGYGDFLEYIEDRMEGNKPIRLKVIGMKAQYDVVIHPLFYSKYTISIFD